jgi:SAM-dependent methyltransferase
VTVNTPSAGPGQRTAEQIREHYEIEKELANRLRSASRAERRGLYSSLYDELFRRVPLHPQLTDPAASEGREQSVALEMNLLRPFLSRDSTFLEVGPGDCALSLEVATVARRVYAVDVSAEVARTAEAPENFRHILSDGCCIPLPPNSVDVAYSNQLMEHLHPGDAIEQLQQVHTVLAPGGIYVCVTPNRLTGPHDVSMYFDEVATGFHLKEYTASELSRLFREVGFVRVGSLVQRNGKYTRLPIFPTALVETCLSVLPHAKKKAIGRKLRGPLLSIRLIGVK